MREYKKLDLSLTENFIPYRLKNTFADTTFSMLWAWNEEFDYHICEYENAISVTDTDEYGRTTYMVIMKEKNEDLPAIIFDICVRAKNSDQPPAIEYIGGEDIGLYCGTLEKMGLPYEVTTENIYDDYVYETSEFINLSGNSNRSKRGGYNFFVRNHPNAVCKEYTGDMYDDMFGIFDKWCGEHDCGKCFYGCEKKAIKRFMEAYDPNCHLACLLYDGDTPLSFAVCERINEDTVSYYFQKNSVRERGLTYYLNREMALTHPDIKYINLGENMGLAGLKNDKQSLHPCRMLRKYTVTINV